MFPGWQSAWKTPYFKRLSNIKDTGKIIPGHGGILDRIDGMVFAFPFFYILNLIIEF